eukprot:TRINITY_DN1002_c0_g1_i1.p1 TRINITY_DN1002_c0_g1~~TRINITY_DN1002_c0_g1_i1.p1  ORF type:complete len:274 (+),score=51.62 TRINITY_DN1002_c0_g1_i1:114-935(+)
MMSVVGVATTEPSAGERLGHGHGGPPRHRVYVVVATVLSVLGFVLIYGFGVLAELDADRIGLRNVVSYSSSLFRALGYVPFYAISMVNSPRRKIQREFMNRSSFSMEFFDAINGRQLQWNSTFALNRMGVHYVKLDQGQRLVQYNATKCNERYKRLLTYGELGCALSHYELWRKCVRMRVPMMFVMEDDVYFTKTDLEIRAMLQRLPDPEEFDIAFFQDHIAPGLQRRRSHDVGDLRPKDLGPGPPRHETPEAVDNSEQVVRRDALDPTKPLR